MDCSPPASPVHGLFQARILEWVAISFSKKGCFKLCLLMRILTNRNLGTMSTKVYTGKTSLVIGGIIGEIWCEVYIAL